MVGYKHLGKWQRSNRFLPGWLRRPSHWNQSLIIHAFRAVLCGKMRKPCSPGEKLWPTQRGPVQWIK